MRSISLLASVLLAGAALSLENAPAAEMHGTQMVATATQPVSAQLAATRNALRGLWHSHVVTVRKVVVAAVAGKVKAQKRAEAEVVKNAHAIADAIEPFYGVAARDQLFTLLAGHYGAVKSYLEASLAKDAAKESRATDQITSNADAIATFLSGANPNLPKDALLELLQIHGSHHISQIQQLIAKDSAGEKKTWADMTAHMNVIADALADALAKQFPAKF